jgi:hypothetical protein
MNYFKNTLSAKGRTMLFSSAIKATITVLCLAFLFSIYSQESNENAPKQPVRPEDPALAAPASKPVVKPVKPAAAPAVKASPSPVLSKDTLVIVGRLVEIPGKFPPNDLYNYVFIMKYRVIKVLKGSYAPRDILVGHYNPLIPRTRIKGPMAPFVKGNLSGFEENAVHTLVLIKPIEGVWKDAVEDNYPDSDIEKYYALKADMAN